MSWAAVAGAAIGAVGSIASADSGGDTSTASKEPWKKAQPWIEDNIKTGQALQNYYAQNPFNSIQQGALDNTLSDVNLYRNNIAPGLMGFANKLMGTNYQRGNATGTSTNNAGLLSGTSTGQSGAQGLLSSSGAFPTSFSVPAQQTSGVNFNALNPLYKDPNASTSTASAQPTDEDIAREWMRKALFASDANIPQVGGYWGDGGTQTAQDLRKMLGQKDPLQNLWMG